MKNNALIIILLSVTVGAFLAEESSAQQIIVGPGGTYATPFSPAGSVTVDPPDGGLLTLSLGGSAGPTDVGNWDLAATGGASISAIGLGLLETGSSTALTGSSLTFGSSNNDAALLSLIGTGTAISSTWTANFTLDQPGSEYQLSPFTTYNVSFFMDGQNGLLDNTLNLSPAFTFEFLDGTGQPLQEQGGGTVLNLVGLLGSGVEFGTVNLSFTTDASVASGPVTLRFTGSADLDTAALELGQQFADVSNLTVTANPVPEPSGLMCALAGAMFFVNRRRR